MIDEKPIDEMNKDELDEYALAEFGVEIDKRRKLEDLRADVMALSTKQVTVKKVVIEPVQALYLRHSVNGRVYLSTPTLVARKDMIPCDANGKNV